MKKLLLLFVIFILTLSCKKNEAVKEYRIMAKNVAYDIVDKDINFNDSSEYIIVLGDLQEYTNNYNNFLYYKRTLEWIYSQKQHGLNIKCILQVGDITSNNTNEQFKIFYDVTKKVAYEIPFISCIGNHDYTWGKNSKILDRNSTLFSKYAYFPLLDEYIIEQFEENKIDNVIYRNYIYSDPYYILSLEFGPRKEVIEWANKIVSSNKTYNFILLTHEFLTSKGERIDNKSSAEEQIINSTYSTPEEIWNKLIYENDNISFVLCGHNGFSSYLMSENKLGRAIPQILFNLQYLKNGGNGLIQVYQFPQKSDSVNVFIYNTVTMDTIRNEKAKKFSFKYKY